MIYSRGISLVCDRIHCDVCDSTFPDLGELPDTFHLARDKSMGKGHYRIADGLTLEDVERKALQAGWSKEVVHSAIRYFCPECAKK